MAVADAGGCLNGVCPRPGTTHADERLEMYLANPLELPELLTVLSTPRS
jgi:hypothetical protein